MLRGHHCPRCGWPGPTKGLCRRCDISRPTTDAKHGLQVMLEIRDERLSEKEIRKAIRTLDAIPEDRSDTTEAQWTMLCHAVTVVVDAYWRKQIELSLAEIALEELRNLYPEIEDHEQFRKLASTLERDPEPERK